jgi:formylglycine-generating enzyme required for sulfatase activity
MRLAVIWRILLGSVFFNVITIHNYAQDSAEPLSVQIGSELYPLYNKRCALIIGVESYRDPKWDRLETVASDVLEIEKALKRNNFVVRVVKTDRRSKKKIQKDIDTFIDEFGSDENNSLLFYLSGHGLLDGSETTEYLAIHDTPKTIPENLIMDDLAFNLDFFVKLEKKVKCRHILCLFDICFAGNIFEDDVFQEPQAAKPIKIAEDTSSLSLVKRNVRQFITAGGIDETVEAANSLFRRSFVQAISTQEADYNGDGYVTASELGNFMQVAIQREKNGQHPQYGKLKSRQYNLGEYVFKPTLFISPSFGIADSVAFTGDLELFSDLAGTVSIRSLKGDTLITKDILSSGATNFDGLLAGEVEVSLVTDNQLIFNNKVRIVPNHKVSIMTEDANGKLFVTTDVSGKLYVDGKFNQVINPGKKYSLNLRPGIYELGLDSLPRVERQITSGNSAEVYFRKPGGTLILELLGMNVAGNFMLNETVLGFVKNGNFTFTGLTPGTYSAKIVWGSEILWEKSLEIVGNALTTEKIDSYVVLNGIGEVIELLESSDFEKVKDLKKNVTIDWVAIPAGKFIMGSSLEEPARSSDEQAHEVFLDAFKMSKFEITYEQYDAFCRATNRRLPSPHIRLGRNKLPVTGISWNEANSFAQWLGGRLPSEAEWEYACRAGSKTAFNCGKKLTNKDANFDWSSFDASVKYGRPEVKPVGSYAPNAWGLHDMHGNAREYCSDWYDQKYPTTSTTNPTGPLTGNLIVLRGGFWNESLWNCRSASRAFSERGRDTADFRNGFRIVSN